VLVKEVGMSGHQSSLRWVVIAVTLLCGLFVLNNALHAQLGTATIVGTVTDPAGAVVPGASVSATALDTNHQVTVATDSAGAYTIAGLTPGAYDVKVEGKGFNTEIRRKIPLTVGQVLQINFAMKVGSVSQQIEVQGGTPLLETVTSSISGLVNDNQVRGLPLNGRDLSQLVLLQAGVAPTPSSGPSPFQKGGFQKFAVNGQRSTATNYTIDGMDANDPDYALSPGGVSGEFLGVDGIREWARKGFRRRHERCRGQTHRRLDAIGDR
jgi:hypothetical protein